MIDDSVLIPRLKRAGQQYGNASTRKAQLLGEARAAGLTPRKADKVVERVEEKLDKPVQMESGTKLGIANDPRKQWERLVERVASATKP